MKKEDIANCGLDCSLCKSKFADIRKKINELNAAFERVNMEEVSKAIPFMRFKYWGYKKLMSFFSGECPGCREKGGNPFCGIRRCSTGKGYYTCAECEKFSCGKYKTLFKVHIDNEIQNNINEIKEKGLDKFLKKKK